MNAIGQVLIVSPKLVPSWALGDAGLAILVERGGTERISYKFPD